VYDYSLWDGTLYVNEEVRHRRVNPGRAAVIAVALLAVLYTLAQTGLQGVVSPARLQANASTALVSVAAALGGTGWAKLMALSIALSVTAATGTGIVLTARIIYGMASFGTLPAVLGTVSVQYKTPAIASTAVGILIIAAIWVYTLAASAQTIVSDIVGLAGLLAPGPDAQGRRRHPRPRQPAIRMRTPGAVSTSKVPTTDNQPVPGHEGAGRVA
jgi:amino acid transporter